MSTLRRWFSFVVFLAVFAGIASAQVASAPTQKPGLSLNVSAVQETFKSGSPLKVNVTLTNLSNQDITLFFRNGEDRGGPFSVVVHRVYNGKAASETRRGSIRNGHIDRMTLTPEESNASGGWFALKPGKPLSVEENVSALFDLSSPGKYAIGIEMYDPISMQKVKSNTITITVTP